MEVLLPESERIGDGRIEGPGSWVETITGKRGVSIASSAIVA